MAGSRDAGGPSSIDRLTKYAAVFVSLTTLVVGVITFLVQQSNQAETRERESRAAFLAIQLEIYTVVVQLVSELTLDPEIDNDEVKYRENLEKFSRLYYGKMAMVEGPDVAKVMIAIKKLLNDEQNHNRKDCLESKRILSLTLAQCARRSFAEGWGFLDFEAKFCTDNKLDSLQTTCFAPR